MGSACEPILPSEASGSFAPALDLRQADVEAALLQTMACNARLQLGEPPHCQQHAT